MPRRRKGTKYAPLIPMLIRDAQPKYADIEGEPDIRKRRERERARDLARDELFKLYRDAEKRNCTDTLPLEVRWFVEAEKARNNGVLPTSRGGRPTKEHERLLIAIHVRKAIAALGKRRGRVELALHEIADRFGLCYAHVRDIHYDRDRDWRRLVRAEMAWQMLPDGKNFPEG